MKPVSMGLAGRVKVLVVDDAGIIKDLPFQHNLILDRGLDVIASKLICDMFKVAGKGTGTTATKETVASTETYSQSGTTVTRTASTTPRDFVASDVGKILRFDTATPAYARIESITSTTVVEVDRTNTGVTNKHIVFFDVQQDWDDASEFLSTHDSTVTFTKPATDGTVTASGAIFTANDVGRAIYFEGTGKAYTITAYTSATEVEVDITTGDADIAAESGSVYTPIDGDEGLLPLSRTSTYGASSGDNSTTTVNGLRTFKRTFIFPKEPESSEVITGTYSQALGVVTRVTGARDFTAGDVGKKLFFEDGTERTITSYTDASHVNVTPSGTVATQGITLYGFTTYKEVFLSDIEYPGNNLNVRVLLDTPVDAYGPTPSAPAQQLKLVYELDLTVSPATNTTINLGGVITDSGNQMSVNKNGVAVIEGYATSTIDTGGETVDGFSILEPSVPGDLAFSTNKDPLDNFNGPQRSAGTFTTELVADAYVSGAFEIVYRGEFGLTEAIGSTLRTLMLYDVDSGTGAYTFLFNANQTKDGNHVLQIALKKTWDRNLDAA